MSATVVSADGAYIFDALEDIAGLPLVLRAERPAAAAIALSWVEAYRPGAGTAVNVSQVVANADQMLFYGNFGTDICVVRHTISTDTNDNISPASLGDEIVNCLAVNPSNADEMIITTSTGQNLLHTDDGGVSWSTLSASALGFTPTALVVIWGGGGEPHKIFVTGNDGTDVILFFSPNDGVTLTDMAGATLVDVSNVVGIEAGYVA